LLLSEPKSYGEAMSGLDKWQKAIEYEINKLKELGTYVKKEYNGEALVDTTWVFKVKYDPKTGKVMRYRARLVARGFKSKYNVNYRETYSPVARLATIRLAMAIGYHNGIHSRAFDISSAFLHSDLPSPVYLKAPKGMGLKS